MIVMCPTGTEHLRGKILRLTTLAVPSPQHCGYLVDTTTAWNYEGPRMKTKNGITIDRVNDCCLRPIRGDELDADEAPRQLELMDKNAGTSLAADYRTESGKALTSYQAGVTAIQQSDMDEDVKVAQIAALEIRIRRDMAIGASVLAGAFTFFRFAPTWLVLGFVGAALIGLGVFSNWDKAKRSAR